MPETNGRIVYYGEIQIDLNDSPDLAYFLLEKHEMIKTGKYKVVDETAAERQKAEDRRNATKLYEVIYGENARLNIDLAYLRLIAKRWGIGAADLQGKDALQNKLHDVVSEAEVKKKRTQGGRGIDEFIVDVRASDTNEQLKIAGNIRDAVDKGVLIFSPTEKKWQINYGDGTYKDVVAVSIDDLPHKDEVVILYMQEDNHTYSALLGAMGRDTTYVANEVDPVLVRESQAIGELRAWAKSLGIQSYQKGKDQLREEILAVLETQKT